MVNALVWNLLLTTGAAIALTIVCRLPAMCRRPALRHSLWLLLLAKLVTPPLVGVPVLPAANGSGGADAAVARSSRPTEIPRADLDHGSLEGPSVNGTTASVIGDGMSGVVDGVSSPEVLRGGTVPWFAVFVALSLFGTCVLFTVHWIRSTRLCRWLGRAATKNALLAQTCLEVASRLGIRRVVRNCVVDSRTPPLLWGWHRPIVVIPRRLLDDLSPEELQSVVAHELAHYRRNDHLANLFAFIVKTLMWWNPVVWWAHREIRAAQELCCDALAIGCVNTHRARYASTLLKALDFVQGGVVAPRHLALGVGSKSSVLRRFEMIGDAQLSHRLSRWMIAILMVAAIPLICIPVRSQEEERKVVPKQGLADSDSTVDTVEVGGDAGEKAIDDASPVASSAKNLVLVGITRVQSSGDAENGSSVWLLDRDENKQSQLKEGAKIRIRETLAIIEEIGKDNVVLTVQGKRRTWKLGKSLAEALAGEAVPPPDKITNRAARRFKVQVELEEDTDVLILRGDKESVKRIGDLLGQGDQRSLERKPVSDENTPETQSMPHLVVYPLGEQDPHTVTLLLQTLLKETPDVRMDADPQTGKLIVLAPSSTHATIAAALKLLRTQNTKTTKPGGAKTPPSEAKGDAEPKLRFAFRYQNWEDVLKWFAEQAGLTLATEISIPGTFNYTDNKTYTVSESMDLLNRVLLPKGFALLRHNRMLMVVNLDEGIPADLVPRVTVEQLENHGKFEIVSVLFPLGGRDAEVVRAEVSPLLSVFGKAVILPNARQMMVVDRGGRIQTISEIIDTL